MYWLIVLIFFLSGGSDPVSASKSRSYYESLSSYQRAEEILREHLMILDSEPISEPSRQYIMILAMIGGLVDNLNKNQGLYSEIYNDTLNVYGIIGMSVPLLVVNMTNALLDDLKSTTQEIRSIINRLCTDVKDSVNDCNINVSKEVRQNKRLKKEAKLLLRIGRLSIAYTEQFDSRFNTMAESGDPIDYLSTIMEALEGFVSKCLNVYRRMKAIIRKRTANLQSKSVNN